MLTSVSLDSIGRESEEGYPALEQFVARRVKECEGKPLFTTTATRLMEVYLMSLPAERRQHYLCNCCTRFMDKFGGLVTITPQGVTQSILWTPADYDALGLDFFQTAITNLNASVNRAKVNGVFLSSEKEWGIEANVAGPGSKYHRQRWTHLHGTNPNIFKERLKTDEQSIAEKKEDFGVLCRSLAEFSVAAAEEAVRVLESDTLERSEKAIQIAKWFLDLRRMWDSSKGHQKTNLTWRSVAIAPPGFCHVKNTMIGTLLDDITQGMDFDTVSSRWKKKMHPLRYQRPQVLKSGQIDAAEKIIEKLGAQDSLKRKFATLDDVTSIWRPTDVEEKKNDKQGTFGHLRGELTGGAPKISPLTLPSKKMAWMKFFWEILPTAAKIELEVPSTGSFYGLVTAADMDAPPILQWDGLEEILDNGGADDTTTLRRSRNPVSWYFYHGGSVCQQWDLIADWTEVTSVSYKPPHWQNPQMFEHEAWGVMFALRGAWDKVHQKGGGLFPESLKAEYREARAAIEAYTKSATIAGKEEGNANGISFAKGDDNWKCHLRVTSKQGAISEFHLDRWE